MKLVLSLAAFAVAASSFAGTYTVGATSSVIMTGTTVAPGVNVALAGVTGPVRGVGVSGAWSVVTAAGTTAGSSQWSSEFGVTVTNPGGTTSSRLNVGGAGNPNAYSFSPTTTTPWGNLGVTYDTLFNTSSNGTYGFNFNQSYGPTGVTKFDMTSATFFTDYVAPVTTTITANSPTFNRPTSLTAVATGTGTGTGVQYSASSFTIGAAGSYLIGGAYTGLSTSTTTGLWDGYLLVYKGAFDPANPLTNLVGLDDDGSGGFTAGASSMFMDLGTGTYTAVLTEYSNTVIGAAASGTSTLYVAGGAAPVPEPASMVALGLGAVAMIRRRKKA